MPKFAQNAVEWALIRLMRMVGGMKDPGVMRLLKLMRRLASTFGAVETAGSLDEVIDCWKMGPPYTDLVRTMARNSRTEELKDMLDGMFSDPGFRFN